MNNLSVQKNEAVRQKIEAAGGGLVFLPARSLDFNPIEYTFTKLEQSLYKAEARTQETFEAAHRCKPCHHHQSRHSRLVQALRASCKQSTVLKRLWSCGSGRPFELPDLLSSKIRNFS